VACIKRGWQLRKYFEDGKYLLSGTAYKIHVNNK
jgi:hypothetical protein